MILSSPNAFFVVFNSVEDMRDALDQGEIEGKVVAPLKKGIFDQVCQFSIKLAYFSSRKRVFVLAKST